MLNMNRNKIFCDKMYMITAKPEIRGNFIVLNVHTRKEEIKEEQNKSKQSSGRK